MGNGYQAQKYADSQNLFSLGKGAIYPAGSWDISTFRANAEVRRWAPSSRRCRPATRNATSPTTPTSAWA